MKWNVIRRHVLTEPVTPRDGYILPPTSPGMGLAIDAAKVPAKVPAKVEESEEIYPA